MKGVFVIGADTGAGKTMTGVTLGVYLKEQGLPVKVLKPFETGCPLIKGKLLPQDGSLYRLMLNLTEPIEEIVPFRYTQPLAPYQSSAIDNQQLDYAKALQKIRSCLQGDYFFLLEGAGGLLVPLEKEIYNADLLVELGIPTILVSPNRLGTINHTLLTLEALDRRGLTSLGVILSDIDGSTEAVKKVNRDYFEGRLGDLYLGEVPFQPQLRELAATSPGILAETPPMAKHIVTLRKELVATFTGSIKTKVLNQRLAIKQGMK